MPLSEYEQHVLEGMERDLRTSTPGHSGRTVFRAKGYLVSLLGLALLAVGLAAANAIGIALAVCGFAVMMAAASVAVGNARWRRLMTGRPGRLANGVLHVLPALRRYGPPPRHE